MLTRSLITSVSGESLLAEMLADSTFVLLTVLTSVPWIMSGFCKSVATIVAINGRKGVGIFQQDSDKRQSLVVESQEKHGQRIELIQSAGGNLSLCPKSGGLPFSGVLKR